MLEHDGLLACLKDGELAKAKEIIHSHLNNGCEAIEILLEAEKKPGLAEL